MGRPESWHTNIENLKEGQEGECKEKLPCVTFFGLSLLHLRTQSCADISGPCPLVVQSLSHVWFFNTLWTTEQKASISFTISWNLLRLVSIVSIMPSSHLIPCHPLFLLLQSFPATGSFPVNPVNSSHQVAKVLELQVQHQSFQWLFRVDFL